MIFWKVQLELFPSLVISSLVYFRSGEEEVIRALPSPLTHSSGVGRTETTQRAHLFRAHKLLSSSLEQARSWGSLKEALFLRSCLKCMLRRNISVHRILWFWFKLVSIFHILHIQFARESQLFLQSEELKKEEINFSCRSCEDDTNPSNLLLSLSPADCLCGFWR